VRQTSLRKWQPSTIKNDNILEVFDFEKGVTGIPPVVRGSPDTALDPTEGLLLAFYQPDIDLPAKF
jgi:hypothetical protein